MGHSVNISLKAEEIFCLGHFGVTNSLLLTTAVAAVVSVSAAAARRNFRLIPGSFQNLIEFLIEGALSLMDSVLGSREKSEKYLPLIGTIFIFILVSNWAGLLPGVGSLGLRENHKFVPLLRAPSSDLNFTLALALIAVVTINLLAVLALGFRMHFSKFVNFENPVKFFIGLLELVSEFAKIISFSFRLFGNVFAGEVLLTITAFLAPYVVPLPFLMLEIFVGFIQAFVFGMLSLVFIAIATAEHETAAD